jgi:hypothetical protein
MKNIYYNPPYDSPIEDEFALTYTKYINENVDFRAQEIVYTKCGQFRIDFIVELEDKRKIGIKCDGEEFHDKSRDEWRDAAILGDTDVYGMYRINGADIQYHLEDVLYILSIWEPQLFSERGRNILKRIASEVILKVKEFDTTMLVVPFTSERGVYYLSLERRIKQYTKHIKTQFWAYAYQVIKK